jgi:hypothetical protein
MIRTLLLCTIAAGLVANAFLLFGLVAATTTGHGCIEVGAPPCEALCQAEQALDFALPYETPMPELLARFELAGFEVQGVLESLDGIVLFVVTPEGAHPADVEVVVTLEFDPVDFIYMRGRILTVGYDSLFTDLSEGGK